MADGSLSHRKEDHIRIALEKPVVSHSHGTGLAKYRFEHCALPDIALASVSTQTRFLGHSLGAPILLSSMTGGTPHAAIINRNLARAAQTLGLAMGLGSARAAIESPDGVDTYRVRDVAPDILLFANLGAVQLNYGYGATECLRAIETSEADGLILHLNPLQEGLQRDGDTDFSGLLSQIQKVCRALKQPVIVKEVGWGLSASVVAALSNAGVAAVDVAGAGGTSWSEVEGYRAETEAGQRLARDFGEWGIPTAECVIQVRRRFPDLPLIASGGIGSGVDAAKAIALGADLVGLARPLLAAASESEQATLLEARRVVDGLRLAMFCSGVQDIHGLRSAPLIGGEGSYSDGSIVCR